MKRFMNRQTTSLLTAGVIAAATALSASAEMSVRVQDAVGNDVTAPLKLSTRISFGQAAIEIANEGTATLSIPYADALSISFVTPSSVAPVLADSGLRLKHNPVGDQLELTGYAGAPSAMSISSLSGLRMMSLANWTGEAIDVSSLAPGIYILNIDSKTIKFIKQ